MAILKNSDGEWYAHINPFDVAIPSNGHRLLPVRMGRKASNKSLVRPVGPVEARGTISFDQENGRDPIQI